MLLYLCAYICVYIYDGVKTNILGRPGVFGLNVAILSSFGCNAIVVVLRWFLFVKLVKPPGYSVIHWKNGILVVV